MKPIVEFLAMILLPPLVMWASSACVAGEPDGVWTNLLALPLGARAHYSEASGTKPEDVWSLTNGVLVCRGKPRGYLVLAENQADFTLSLEWRRPEGVKPGKAGVLIRVTGPDKIWPRSLEAQLNAGAAGDFWGLGGFALSGPAERLSRADHAQYGKLTNLKRAADAELPAGAWNRYEIEARGGVVALRINGAEVNRATGCDAADGRIVLTAEGDVIEFRDIRLLLAGLQPNGRSCAWSARMASSKAKSSTQKGHGNPASQASPGIP
jgi:hypothetical protein